MPAITTQPKTLKWALPKKSSSGARIQKQARAPQSCKSSSASISSVAHHKKKQPKTEMERLASELAFTYDTLATISVHFESLQLAYTSSKADLKKTYCATRLGPKEKELLAAYDDLGLQVVHLERKINRLESRLQQVRSQEENNMIATTPTTSTISSLPSSSPASSTTTSFDVSPLTSQDASFSMDEQQTVLSYPSYPMIDNTFFDNTCAYPYMMVPPVYETDPWMTGDLAYPSLFAQ
ncbi:hypothetical protein BCR42DRAFT_416719 [Absidia repens]|uniref:Uncharacterized protein n=1 Tax=Absidia repens TaxID=90262 RepID=A0A1X2IF07_9FUNG|nr:hypothetical protein BCR42DRAFT_416719 [Absidia repens]